MKYLLITFFSVLASLSFGIMDIEKQIYTNGKELVEIKKIDALIEEKKKILNQDNSERIKILEEQIKKSKTPNSENTIAMNDEISKLQNIDKTKVIDEIFFLETKRISLSKNVSVSKESFSIIADVFGLSEKIIRVIFLLTMAIIIEMIVFGTSSSGFQTGKDTKKLKKSVKNHGQLKMV
jgi:hypothetical protein